jgi:hypothetical protein
MRTSVSPARVGWFAGALGAAVIAFAGCGGGSGVCGGGACGGNLVGTWSLTSQCNSTNQPTPTTGCTDTVDSSRIKETGTVTFNRNGTYSTSISISGSASETISAQCLSSTTCDNENTVLMQEVTAGQLSSASCTAVASGCFCQFVYVSQTLTNTGTYATAGSSVTTMTTGSTSSSTSTYCVLGSTLTVSSMSMAGMTGPSSSVVFTRI